MSTSYEFQIVSDDVYQESLQEANHIIAMVAKYYGIPRIKVRYKEVINFLIHYLDGVDFYGFTSDIADDNKKERFNNFLSYPLNINVRVKHMGQQHQIFAENVSGYSVFDEQGALVFINANYNQSWGRIIFTIMHELVHVYKAQQNPTYEKIVALMTNSVLNQSCYPERLQPIENETNIIASLLYVSDEVLEKDIMKLNFEQMKEKYTISASALHNRLFNFLKFNHNLTDIQCTQIVLAFRNNDFAKIQDLRLHLEKGVSY